MYSSKTDWYKDTFFIIWKAQEYAPNDSCLYNITHIIFSSKITSTRRTDDRITHLEHILKGDWIYYNQEKEYGKAIGNVWMNDTIQDIILEGGIGEVYRQEQFSYVTDSARAILIDTYD